MKYRDRQDETDVFLEGDKLLRSFRGQGKRVFDAVRRHLREHPRIQKVVSDSTLYAALNGKPSWTPVVQALEYLTAEVMMHPRALCEPPPIPDDWAGAREAMSSHAPALWWYQTLELDDVVKANSFQVSMSRDTPPRAHALIIERAQAWRVRCVEAIDRWERVSRERYEWHKVIEFRVKDALDARGEDAAYQEFVHLRQFGPRSDVDTRAWVHFFDTFDPANPDQPQFDPEEPLGARVEFEALLASGFPRYRKDEPTPPRVETSQQTRSFYSDDLLTCWDAQVEVEQQLEWDPFLRDEEVVEERVTRVRVKVDPKHAVEGEAIKDDRRREVEIVREAGRIVDTVRREVVVPYVWRWRAVDIYDNVGATEGRDRVLMQVGSNCEQDDAGRYLRPITQPLDDETVSRSYSRD